eukprot:35476-Pleurochrysis_carterae.AAC.2
MQRLQWFMRGSKEKPNKKLVRKAALPEVELYQALCASLGLHLRKPRDTLVLPAPSAPLRKITSPLRASCASSAPSASLATRSSSTTSTPSSASIALPATLSRKSTAASRVAGAMPEHART